MSAYDGYLSLDVLIKRPQEELQQEHLKLDALLNSLPLIDYEEM